MMRFLNWLFVSLPLFLLALVLLVLMEIWTLLMAWHPRADEIRNQRRLMRWLIKIWWE